mgnify:CR=1 FL=1
MSFGVRHVAPHLHAFTRANPEVTVDLSLNDRLVDLVEEGFDVAIRIIPYLVAILVAVGMLRSSGALDLLVGSLASVTGPL